MSGCSPEGNVTLNVEDGGDSGSEAPQQSLAPDSAAQGARISASPLWSRIFASAPLLLRLDEVQRVGSIKHIGRMKNHWASIGHGNSWLRLVCPCMRMQSRGQSLAADAASILLLADLSCSMQLVLVHL